MKINHLLFDLDNTLYPASSTMDEGISRRMIECVAKHFNCDIETAKKIRAEHITNYSTTMEWLQNSGMNDVEGFLAYVHPETEADELQPQPGLREFLISLPYPKSILTNANSEHAECVLNKLGIADLFNAITDIRDANFFGKPYWSAYEAALKKSGTTVEDTLFIDDMIKYIDGWNAHGGTGVLIGNANGKPLSPSAKPLADKPDVPKGKIYRLNSIYELPELLKTL